MPGEPKPQDYGYSGTGYTEWYCDKTTKSKYYKNAYQRYEAALQAAKESSIPVQDQERAKKIIEKLRIELGAQATVWGSFENREGAIYGPFNIRHEIQVRHSIRCASYNSEALKKRFYIPGECNCTPEQVAILYDDTPEKTDYINKELKTVSEVDLKAALRKVNEKNKEIRESYKDHTRLDFRIKDSRGFPTGEVVEAAKVTPEAEVSPRVAKLILSIRDELLKLERCPEEAYHLLYQIASPNFDKTDPWSEIEKIAARETTFFHYGPR